MADDAEKKTGGVSATRKKISIGLLVVVSIILVIEARAGFGQMMSGKALSALATEGAFENLSLSDAKSKLSFFPQESVFQETESETIYCYSWFSLLRKAMGHPESEMFVVADKSDPPKAVAYYTDRPEKAYDPVTLPAPAGEHEEHEEHSEEHGHEHEESDGAAGADAPAASATAEPATPAEPSTSAEPAPPAVSE